jgi:pSer/pThr/pTyr-binding forkhead associated (FHA) protein
MIGDQNAAEVGGSLDGAPLRLVVEQGQRPSVEYPIREGVNRLGRWNDHTLVDIDLDDQEPPDQDRLVSRGHARITRKGDQLFIEDAYSTHGTVVSGNRISPGTLVPLAINAWIQVGSVVLRVKG